ncbi:MAG TPA: hypothetical protein VMV44_01240 [Rectinemataceae bacterium]|nr:hypothetical protein [Rectinemataceae bacterium]
MTTLLLLLTLIVGGAMLLTLLAASIGGRGRSGGMSRKARADDDDYDADFTLLADTETKIEELSQMMDYAILANAGYRDGKRATEDLLEKQRLIRSYLVDYAGQCCSLLLRRIYCDEVGWFLSLLDEGSISAKSEAFRGRLRKIHDDFAERKYLGQSESLDKALEDVLADFDLTMQGLIADRMESLIGSESPLSADASMKRRGRLLAENLEAGHAALNKSFDLFSAELELR